MPAPPRPVTILPAMICHNWIPSPLETCQAPNWLQQIKEIWGPCVREKTADTKQAVRNSQRDLTSVRVAQLAIL